MLHRQPPSGGRNQELLYIAATSSYGNLAISLKDNSWLADASIGGTNSHRFQQLSKIAVETACEILGGAQKGLKTFFSGQNRVVFDQNGTIFDQNR